MSTIEKKLLALAKIEKCIDELKIRTDKLNRIRVKQLVYKDSEELNNHLSAVAEQELTLDHLSVAYAKEVTRDVCVNDLTSKAKQLLTRGELVANIDHMDESQIVSSHKTALVNSIAQWLLVERGHTLSSSYAIVMGEPSTTSDTVLCVHTIVYGNNNSCVSCAMYGKWGTKDNGRALTCMSDNTNFVQYLENKDVPLANAIRGELQNQLSALNSKY